MENLKAMTDEQLVRLSRILRLTKAVHEFGPEDQAVAEELAARLSAKLAKEVSR